MKVSLRVIFLNKSCLYFLIRKTRQGYFANKLLANGSSISVRQGAFLSRVHDFVDHAMRGPYCLELLITEETLWEAHCLTYSNIVVSVKLVKHFRNIGEDRRFLVEMSPFSKTCQKLSLVW